MTLRNRQKGFTIVELLIVIVVIGILVALVITTFAGIQARARDTERETDIKSIHGHLEVFYADNGYYPALADLNDETWRDTNMSGLDAPDAFTPPNSTATTLDATAGGDPEQYGYDGSDGANTCLLAGEECTDYTLSAILEDGGTATEEALN